MPPVTLRNVLGVEQESSRAENRSNECEDSQTNHQRNPCYQYIHEALYNETYHLPFCCFFTSYKIIKEDFNWVYSLPSNTEKRSEISLCYCIAREPAMVFREVKNLKTDGWSLEAVDNVSSCIVTRLYTVYAYCLYKLSAVGPFSIIH